AAARQQYERLVAVEAGSGKSSVFLQVLAAVVHGQGLSVWAARLFGLADSLARSGQSLGPRKRVTRALASDIAIVRAEVHARLGDHAFAEGLAYGQTMTVEEVLAVPTPPPAAGAQAAASSLYTPFTARGLDVLRRLPQDLTNSHTANHLTPTLPTFAAHLATTSS